MEPVLTGCPHNWEETEVHCEDCGSHNAVHCESCGSLLDLVYEADPRDI